MATVIENNPPAEREVVREPVDTPDYATSSSSSSALTLLIVLIVAVLAVGAFMLYVRSPGTVTPRHAAATVERSINNAGTAAGDAAGTVTRSTTTTTNTQ